MRPELRALAYRQRPPKAKLRADLIAHCRANGCTCNPTIIIPEPRPGKVGRLQIVHDDDCPHPRSPAVLKGVVDRLNGDG